MRFLYCSVMDKSNLWPYSWDMGNQPHSTLEDLARVIEFW